MKVCFFGSYEKDSFGIPSGNTGTLLKKILETQNIEVIECQYPIKKISSFFSAYIKLFFQHRKIKYDVMLIPWRGILTLPLAKLIHKKPIIYFPAFSIYDTLVNDRKKIKKNSIKAKFIHFVDKLACNWSDIVVLESNEEINYFIDEFNIPKEKLKQCHMSADESIFNPKSQEKRLEKKFTVLFFGSFIPLHGINTIVKAASILQSKEEMIFNICGDGQTKPEILKLISNYKLDNIKLLGIVSKDTLLENILYADICLGIFGNTGKARKVLTNKVFQILASKKPLITMESPTAIDANLVDKKNVILVPPDNAEKLAEAIMLLKNDTVKKEEIAAEGYKTYCEHLSMDTIGKKLVGFIHELVKTKE